MFLKLEEYSLTVRAGTTFRCVLLRNSVHNFYLKQVDVPDAGVCRGITLIWIKEQHVHCV